MSHLVAERWPKARDAALFDRVPFLIADKKPEKITLGQLAEEFGGRSIEDVLQTHVESYLEHSNFNGVSDVRSGRTPCEAGGTAWRPSVALSLPRSTERVMIISVLTVEELRTLLLRLPDVNEVRVVAEGRKFLAFVLASRFEGVDEGARQREVWDLLLEELPPEQVSKIEFVFTDTPEERADAEREASASSG
jgi:acid stress-induced BolA-like protein IbaG/YrbA